MSNSTLKVSQFMTKTPHFIDMKESVYRAMEIMEGFDIRHLPVMAEGVLHGVLTERDVKTLFTFAGTARNPKEILVGDVCTCPTYVIDPETPLSVAAAEMARQKYGSAVVMKQGQLVGIFTTVDACQALADLCMVKD